MALAGVTVSALSAAVTGTAPVPARPWAVGAPDLAAMIDRLVHHGHLLVFKGEGCRMKYRLMNHR